jgi:TolB-like protein/tetratricopeptide (TPR) repeat protein
MVYGNGVDVAIGLRTLAVPGGICLSQSVYEQVKLKGHVGIEYAGEKKLKDHPEPISIYQVVEPGVEKGYLSLWAELRRRNVFRVGAAYAVVGWLLIQVSDVILSTFQAPNWVIQSSIALVILGFPLALVLAWIYELTPMGLKRSDDVLRQTSITWLTGRRLDGAIISLLVVAVVFLVYENYVSKGLVDFDEAEPASVAVLAFQNQSSAPENEYFADGLADELLSVLGRIRELKVASRTASFYFKGKDVSVETIASKLMVDNVLSGSVRRDGARVRVTAVLDDTVSDNLLWSETYDRKLEDILDIQSDIAQSVATAIVPVLSPESEDRIKTLPTENTEAYQFYLRGRDYLRQPAEETTLASAIELFDRAVGLDPRFAEAYAGLCDAHIGGYDLARRLESFQSAEAACHRALTLDSGFWEVHVALGNLYRTNSQYDSAILEFSTALELQPNAVSPYLALAQTYAAQNRLELAEETFHRAEEVEAGYWGVHRAFGIFLYRQSRYDEAIKRHIKVTELVPDSGIGYDNLGNVYLQIADLDKAESAFNASPLPSRWTYTNRGLVYYFRGDFAKAVADQKHAIDIAPEVHASWGFLGDAYRFVPGEEENARNAYERAIELVERHLTINPNDWRSIGQLAMYLAYAGRTDEALAQVEKLLAHSSDSDTNYFVTRVRLQVGDTDGAYESFESTVAGGGWSRALLARDPDIVALRDKAGYAALLAEPSG